MSEAVLSQLHKAAWMIYVAVHCPRMNYAIRGGEIRVDGVQLTTDKVTKPRWKLMPSRIQERIQEVQKQITVTLDQYRVPVRSAATRSSLDAYGNVVTQELRKNLDEEKHYLRGIHLIPDSRISDCIAELQAHDQELRAIIEEVCEDLPAFHEEVRSSLDDDVAWDQVRKMLPTREKLMAGTGVEWVPFPLNVAESSIEAANTDQVRQAVHSRLQTFMEGLIESIVDEPRQEVAKALQDLDELIQRNGRVTTRSFVPVTRAIEKLRNWNISNAELDAKIEELQSRFTTITPSAQNREVAERNGLTAAIRATIDEARNEMAINETYGRGVRKLQFG